MKSDRKSGFFTSPPDAKKARTIIKHTGNMLDLPDEIWLEMLKYFNKKQLRDVSPANSFFYNLIAKHKLFQNAPWPVPDYEKLLPTKSKHVTFNKLAFEEAIGQFCLVHLDNGDVVAGMEDGRIFVLGLGRTEWQAYGRHERPTASRGLRKATVHHATFLPSGLLATSGDDGIRLWDCKTRQQIQFLSLAQLGWAAKQDGVHELSNGNLVSSSKINHFHLWRKTGSPELPYEYDGQISDVSDDKITEPFIWQGIKDVIVGCGDKYITRYDLKGDIEIQRIEITALKQRIAQTMQALRRDDVFVAAHLDPGVVESFNEAADDVAHTTFDFDWEIPLKLLADGYVMVTVDYFEFLLKPFDDAMTPIYLGCVTEMNNETTDTDDLIISRVTLHGVEIMGGFDKTTNTFKFKHTFEFGSLEKIILFTNGHALVIPRESSPYIYDIYSTSRLHDLNLELPEGVDFDLTSVIRLKSGDLLGMYHFSGLFERHSMMIWDYYTGKLKKTFLSGGSVHKLANGDLMTHSRYDERGDSVSVVRFDVKR